MDFGNFRFRAGVGNRLYVCKRNVYILEGDGRYILSAILSEQETRDFLYWMRGAFDARADVNKDS